MRVCETPPSSFSRYANGSPGLGRKKRNALHTPRGKKIIPPKGYKHLVNLFRCRLWGNDTTILNGNVPRGLREELSFEARTTRALINDITCASGKLPLSYRGPRIDNCSFSHADLNLGPALFPLLRAAKSLNGKIYAGFYRQGRRGGGGGQN